MKRIIPLALAAATVLLGQTADSQLDKELHNIQQYCGPAVAEHFLEPSMDSTCAQQIVNGKPLKLTYETFAPGSGLGLGLGYQRDFAIGQSWQNNWEVGGSGSVQGAWEGHLVATLDRAWSKASKAANVKHEIKEHLEVHPFVTAQQLTKVNFYGEGMQSPVSGLALYAERDIRVGLGIAVPIAWWLNAGAKAEGLWTDIGPASTSTTPSVAGVYNELQAPGIGSQPPFTHFQFYIRPHYPNQEPFNLIYKIGYEYFQAHSLPYSFGRFRADLLHNIYPEHSGKRKRDDSILSFYGRLTLAQTSGANVVPFFLQDTLGGTDINGDPSLRAFPDYRFRAPDDLAIEVEFDRRIWKVLGIMVFYDTGTVADRASDLSLANMRQSVGGGLTLWSASKVVFRAYVGFGGGEGTHTFVGILPLPGPVAAPYRTY
ncbi:MAG: hypothetical protein ABSH50_21045 [Bryobacteraceae bacterium]|jgi:hypothetical protein